ncbi:hypothetical protein EUX98_g4174 [Antrodiella citrinella]|uniref:HTH APSES-type domain-containing protein n=1 Tax=Antrodiella citrinella TaxID=2447956 RepID=A0A4S4MUQ7_9APHY|nr:hypothetical protein EUX98_g4174 [Antrodiella citrinella]
MPAITPKQRISTSRPPLPVANANPSLADLSRPPPVKFQEIIRDGQATVVGRVKIPTPTGHAFILRRLDTGAVSLTTMFRAAFPSASDDAEKVESSWVKNNYDVAGHNRTGKSRFAGTWVSPETAKQLAEVYRLGPIIAALADANPDPNVVYRKATKTTQPPTGSPAATATPTQPPAVPADLPSWTPLTPAATSVASTVTATSTTVTTSPTKTSRAPATSPAATRRSTRLKSPAPAPAPPKTPRPSRAARERERERERDTVGSDETAVEHEEASEAAKVAEVDMAEDLREQKELIERLKAERAQKAQESIDDMEEDVAAEASIGQKRGREDEKEELRLNIKEPETEERAIATNKRVAGVSAQHKSLAWGTLLFAVGMGAVSFIPSIPSLAGYF